MPRRRATSAGGRFRYAISGGFVSTKSQHGTAPSSNNSACSRHSARSESIRCGICQTPTAAAPSIAKINKIHGPSPGQERLSLRAMAISATG